MKPIVVLTNFPEGKKKIFSLERLYAASYMPATQLQCVTLLLGVANVTKLNLGPEHISWAKKAVPSAACAFS